MKTLKLALIATIVSLSMLAYANQSQTMIKISNFDDPDRKTQVDSKLTIGLYLSLKRALQNPNLVEVMHQQLDKSLLDTYSPVITVTIEYLEYLIKITGSYEEWISFFSSVAIQSNGLAESRSALSSP